MLTSKKMKKSKRKWLILLSLKQLLKYQVQKNRWRQRNLKLYQRQISYLHHQRIEHQVLIVLMPLFGRDRTNLDPVNFSTQALWTGTRTMQRSKTIQVVTWWISLNYFNKLKNWELLYPKTIQPFIHYQWRYSSQKWILHMNKKSISVWTCTLKRLINLDLILLKVKETWLQIKRF